LKEKKRWVLKGRCPGVPKVLSSYMVVKKKTGWGGMLEGDVGRPSVTREWSYMASKGLSRGF
jgi:hypothetical protein